MKKMLLHVIKTLLVVGFFAGAMNAASANFDGLSNVELTDGSLLVMQTGTISLNGDRVISLPGSNVFATLKIGAELNSGTVTVRPGDGVDAVLLFDVISAGSVLEVQLLNDLVFMGNDAKPMFIGVRGKGEVRVRMPYGKNITLRSASPDTAGAHLRILMEQNKSQMENSSQLSFVAWSFDTDEVNTDNTKHSVIEIGQNSSLSFLSQHKSGLVDVNGVLDYGYGSLAFDPSNNSTGRMIVKIAAGNEAVDFKDGAFMIYGSYVEGSGISVTDVQTSDFRNRVIYKYRAGICATMRIVDDVARAAHDGCGGELNSYLRNRLNSRGLAVLNYNNSYPRLANNYDQTIVVAEVSDYNSVVGLTDSHWFVANTVQTGFVLGNNGMIEVDNNRFLDYFACGLDTSLSNFPQEGVHVFDGDTDEGGSHSASQVKKHNPSALIVDGNAFRRTNTTAAADTSYEYDAQDIAQIVLRGNAGIFARVAADSVSGSVAKLTLSASGGEADGLTAKYLNASVGHAPYDGKAVLIRDEDNLISPKISQFGEIAIDVEGPLHVLSTPSWNGVVEANGFINMPSILINHRGVEMAMITGTLIELSGRPLPLSSAIEYFRYNNSCLLVNDYITLENTRFVHNDLGRDVSLIGSGDALPAVIGGELPTLIIGRRLHNDPSAWILDYSGSPIYLENSTIECHESLVSAGVHWVVRDRLIDQNRDGVINALDGETLAAGDNISHIVFYNRGHAQDLDLTGLGRYFQLGSRRNTMADGGTVNPVTLADETYPVSSLRDAFINVYRQRPIPAILNPHHNAENTIELSLDTVSEEGVTTAEKSIHLLHISDRSSIDLGWSAGQYKKTETIEGSPVSNVYVEADSRYAPWEFSTSVLDAVRDLDPTNHDEHRFNPYVGGRGRLSFNGNTICVDGAGRYNSAGILTPSNNELSPRGVRDRGGILYINFGGELQADNAHDLILNTVIARRTSAINEAAGLMSIDSDQIIFQPRGKVETYGFDVDANPNPSLINLSSPSIVSINVSELPTPDDFSPIKGLDLRSAYHWPHEKTRFLSRSTDSVVNPVTMPSSGMLVMGSGDTIDQAQVFGATRANPFHLRLTGDGVGFARVREFVSVASDPAVLGEGPHAALFLDNGARIGLGSRSWNGQSVNAWNQLGLDKVSLYPNGNGVVDLNSDLIITDKLPIIATENFGQGDAPHQLIFYSAVPREIRIVAGGELDLNSFGRCAGASYQQIVFSGQVRLVIEPGAKIRFPSSVTGGNHNRAPVLLFTDNSQCVIVSQQHADADRYEDVLNGFDKIRVKLLGIGQLWFDREAKMTVFDNAQLSVESDVATPLTDVTINLMGNSRMLIGDEVSAGGVFQIGNVVTGGGDGTNRPTDEEPGSTGNISFTLKLNGEKANFHIDRSGFFGLAVGMVNKVGNPNGNIPAPTNGTPADPDLDPDHKQYGAWQVQTLRDVKNLTIDVTRGYFDHNQIYDGSAASAFGSVLAVGPLDYNENVPLDDLNGGKYTFKLGLPADAYVRGGGNIVYVDAGIPETDPLTLNIWSNSADIAIDGIGNSGKYTILAPSPMIRTYLAPIARETVDVTLYNFRTSTPYSVHITHETNLAGDALADLLAPPQLSYQFQSRAVTEINSQGGALYEMYSNFSMPIYGGYTSLFVAAGKNGNSVVAGYLVGINPTTIVRTPVIIAKDMGNNTANPAAALDKAYFIGTTPSGGDTINGRPETLKIPN